MPSQTRLRDPGDVGSCRLVQFVEVARPWEIYPVAFTGIRRAADGQIERPALPLPLPGINAGLASDVPRIAGQMRIHPDGGYLVDAPENGPSQAGIDEAGPMSSCDQKSKNRYC